jgi:endonuclease/exonuclease/phosphatase family metal-dependent hydrolase
MNKIRILFLTDFFMVVATLIVLILSIITAISGSLKPDPDSYINLIGLLLPLIIFSSLVFILYWSFRKSFFVLIPLLALSINYNSILNNIQFRAEESDQISFKKLSFKIASFNIHEFKFINDQTSVIRVSEYVKSENISLICFQEYKVPYFLNTAELIGVFDFMPYNFIKEPDKNEIGMAIFSRYPIIRTNKINFEDTGNGLIWADVKIDSSRVIRIINNHLQTTNYTRNRNADVTKKVESLKRNAIIRAHQAEVVRAIIDSTKIPVIVCGDFNDIPTSYTFSTIKGENLADGFREAGSWLGGTFRGMGGLLRIDYILHSKEFKCLKYSNPNIALSDHRPVISELMFRY